MIKATNLALRRGAKLLFENVSTQIFPGQRVGVVGANGVGKSSLFSALAGRLELDSGSLTVPASWRIAEVLQTLHGSDETALAFAMAGDQNATALDAAITVAEQGDDMMHLAELHEQFLVADGHTLAARTGVMLDGLGFDFAAQQRPVDSFSGGWQMRLQLARALIAPSDLLMLDEPTNHLDLDSLIWLATFLRAYRGTLLVISHDREFLDDVLTHTLHLDGAAATLYTGNYSEFARQRALRKLDAEREAVVVDRQRKHLQSFIDRFKAKASKAKQAQSRVKMLEKLKSAPSVRDDSVVDITIPEPLKLPTTLKTLRDVTAGYGQIRVLSGVNLNIAPGDRIGLLGRNGVGKSTLIKVIADALPDVGGDVGSAKELVVGYFAQQEVEQLESDREPLNLLKERMPSFSDQQARDWLGRFRFGGEMAMSPVGQRSGGEKARLALALILAKKPNLLLLDEPTNHLDIGMREALAESLADFGGAVLLVSHDRALLESCCDQYLLVHGGSVRSFDGDMSDYARWSLSGGSKVASVPVHETVRPEANKATRSSSGDAKVDRAQRKALQTELRRVETQIAQAKREAAQLETELQRLAAADKAEAEKLATLTVERIAKLGAVDSLETRWLELSESLEA